MNLKRTDQRALLLLLAVTALLLVLGLGSRELWGAETRWANISLQMLQSGDYFDPYLKGGPYYDKPLLSYWLITASAWLTGAVLPAIRQPWADLHLPGVPAGLHPALGALKAHGHLVHPP